MTRVRLKRRVLLSAQVRTALKVAGSASGGGAGIQADLKSFASIGVHGTSVITCVTAQNTRAVDSIFAIPTAEIRKQLRAVLDDFDVRAAKTGMLYSAGIVRAVANGLRRTSFPLVVDPVMIATVGARLEKDDFQAALVDRLFDRAALVTPNRYEAERLSRVPGLVPGGSRCRDYQFPNHRGSIGRTSRSSATVPSAQAHYQSGEALPKTSSRLTKLRAIG